jgi:hypothetical protein
VFLSIDKISYTHYFFMQVCCGSGERPLITREMRAKYPECRLQYAEGKL